MSSEHLDGTGAVAALEGRLRAFYGMKHGLAVANATLGLLAVGQALGLAGAEFVTTPYTYGATLAGWLWLGARPVFADIDPHTLALDPISARRAITPRTKALLAVDIFGIPADMVALRKLADEFGIWYVADAAQSLGAYLHGRPASSLADALVVSFTVGKPLVAGEGGAVLTQDTRLYEKLLWYTQHPLRQRRELGFRLVNEFALNARIHPYAAALAYARFDRALKELRGRQRHCVDLIERLNAVGLTEPIRFREEGIEPSFFRLTAAWKGRPQAAILAGELNGMRLCAEPVRLLYRQVAFRAQYARYLRGTPRCSTAERQAMRRFSIETSLLAEEATVPFPELVTGDVCN